MKHAEYAPVLWDIDAEKAETLSPDFIVRRVLSYGTLGLIVHTMQTFGRDMVKRVFFDMKPSAISAKKYAYLKTYLLA
jgi:hypothetical protein